MYKAYFLFSYESHILLFQKIHAFHSHYNKSRRFLKGYAPAIEEAVEQAITECINEGILAEFLKKNRAEAMEVSIFEYNEELHLANLRREGYEEGIEQGIQQGIQQGKALDILELLSELGEVPDTLKNLIESKTDTKTLNKWLKLAAKSTTIKDFEGSM